MGYGGKVREQRRARELRAQSWTLQDIATELGVSKSSVSLWVRDVEFVPNPRRRSHWTRTNPHPLHLAKLAEVERCHREGAERIGVLSEREFLVLGAALYAGEGAKTRDTLAFANSDPRLIRIFVTWLRRFFDDRRVEVSSEALPPRGPRPRCRDRVLVGCHADPAIAVRQALPRSGRRHDPQNEAPDGLSGGRLLVDLVVPPCHGSGRGGIVTSCHSGVAQLAERRTVKPFVVGSSPTPGANATTGGRTPAAALTPRDRRSGRVVPARSAEAPMGVDVRSRPVGGSGRLPGRYRHLASGRGRGAAFPPFTRRPRSPATADRSIDLQRAIATSGRVEIGTFVG